MPPHEHLFIDMSEEICHLAIWFPNTAFPNWG